MKITLILFIVAILSISTQAQMMFEDPYRQEVNESYTIDLIIQYDNKPLNEWSFAKERLTLGMGMYGDISLKIIDSSQRLTSIEDPTFQIAIIDDKTGTQRMLSNKVYTKVNAEEIVSQCDEGESIIILTTDRKYALPKNIIELMLGC